MGDSKIVHWSKLSFSDLASQRESWFSLHYEQFPNLEIYDYVRH